MRIAIIAWGSLIWDPRDLPREGNWQSGGPILPIEFSRISQDCRLTLVIDYENGALVSTRYGLSPRTNFNDAIEDLRAREGTLIAKSFAIRLVQMGLEVFFVGETVTPIVEEGNVVIIVSYTGETMSAIQTANIVRRVGAKVVAITANGHSKLGSASNLVIELNPPKDEERKRLAPLGTLFEDATMVYLDSIVATLMEKLGQSEGSMRKRHAIWV